MQQRKGNFSLPVRLLAPILLTILPFLVLPFLLVSDRMADGMETRSATTQTELPKKSTKLFTRPLPTQDTVPFNKANLTYDASVLKTLKKMNLSMDHLDLWMSEHPDTALKHLRYMPAAMQRDVTSTVLFIRSCNGRIDEKTAWREAAALVHYSAKYGVPSTLTTAVAHAESTFNPGAVSPKGAAGVMQVMWRVHNGLLESNGIMGKDSLADPEKGVAAGCLLLSRYIKAYGSIQTAMNRYYGGSSLGYQRKINRNMVKIAAHRASMH